MSVKKRVGLLAAALQAMGCAAYLKEPVIVRSPQAYLIKRTSVTEKEQGGQPTCVTEVSAEVVYLAGAEEHRIDTQRGFLASNQLSVQLHESGTLKQVSLNSDPRIDETLGAVGGLLEKLAGAAATVAPLAAAPRAAQAILRAPPCTPSVTLKLAPLACFMDPRPAGSQEACPANPGAW